MLLSDSQQREAPKIDHFLRINNSGKLEKIYQKLKSQLAHSGVELSVLYILSVKLLSKVV